MAWEALAVKTALPLAAIGGIIGQTAATPPYDGFVGAGSQVAAWTVVAYFARALISGNLVVRQQSQSMVVMEKLVEESHALAKRQQELLDDAHQREERLHEALAAVRYGNRRGSHPDG